MHWRARSLTGQATPADLGKARSPCRVASGAGMGCVAVCALDPSSLCCLCPGGSTMDSSAGGKARPQAGEDKEGFLSKLKKMFTS